MKIKDFYDLIELKREPEATLLPNLRYRTMKYPFFQPDIFLYIKCLYLSNSENFADELTRLAPFVSDRKALFYYVMNDRYKQFQRKVDKKLTTDRTNILIDAFFETLSDTEPSPVESLISGSTGMLSSDYFSYLELSDFSDNVSSEQKFVVNIASEEDDLLETEFDVQDITVEEPEALNNDEGIPPLKHQDIIDRFLEKAVDEDVLRIKLEPAEENLSEEEQDALDSENTDQGLEEDYFFTQTLANIYIKQKKYERAYEIIKHLSLNYPEKNIYFADQLSFLEKIIKNLNKK